MKGQTILPGQGKRARMRAEIESGTRQPFRQKDVPPMMFRCGRCRQLFGELMVTEHLMTCQPNGAKCGKCGDTYLPDAFLAHFKACRGRKQEGENFDTFVARSESVDGLKTRIKLVSGGELNGIKIIESELVPDDVLAFLVKDGRVAGVIKKVPVGVPPAPITDPYAMRKPLPQLRPG